MLIMQICRYSDTEWSLFWKLNIKWNISCKVFQECFLNMNKLDNFSKPCVYITLLHKLKFLFVRKVDASRC